MITAVIPVRKGSQRVKNKNIRKFDRKNLLIYKIEKLKKLEKSIGPHPQYGPVLFVKKRIF